MLLASAASAKEFSRDEMISYMKKIVRNKEFVEKAISSYKTEGYVKELLRFHFNEVYKSDELIVRMVDEMINSRMLDEGNLNSLESNIDARKFGAELTLNLMLKGISRLDVKEMRGFIKYVAVLLNSMNYKQCKKYLVDGSSMTALENTEIEVKAYKNFTKQELENYFSLMRKALFAELRDFPLEKTINADEKIMADKAFENEFMELAKQNKISIDIFEAMIDMANATDKNACEAGRIIINTIVNMKGFTGDLMIKSYIISIQP